MTFTRFRDSANQVNQFNNDRCLHVEENAPRCGILSYKKRVNLNLTQRLHEIESIAAVAAHRKMKNCIPTKL